MYLIKFHNGQYLAINFGFSGEKVDAKRFTEKQEAWYYADTVGGKFGLVPSVIDTTKGY